MAVATLPFPKMLVKLLEFDGTVTRDNLPVLLEKWAERFFPQEFYPRGTYWQSQHEASFQSKLDKGASACTKTDTSSLTTDEFLICFGIICSEEEEKVVIGEDFEFDCFRFQITDVMVLIRSVGFIQDPLAFLATWILGAKIWHKCHLCNNGGHRDKMHCKNPQHLQLSEIKDNTSRQSTMFSMIESAFKDDNMQDVAVLQRRYQTSFNNPKVELGFPVGDVHMTTRFSTDFLKNQTTLENPSLRKDLVDSLHTFDRGRKLPRRRSRNSSGNELERQRNEHVRLICKEVGCRVAYKGGICITHGAKKPLCKQVGCKNVGYIGGICITHGAKRTACKIVGCEKRAYKGGICYEHGAKKPVCKEVGCKNQVYSGGICVRHGAKRAACKIVGCEKRAFKRGGLCGKHGPKNSVCKKDGCKNQAFSKRDGLCRKHRSACVELEEDAN